MEAFFTLLIPVQTQLDRCILTALPEIGAMESMFFLPEQGIESHTCHKNRHKLFSSVAAYHKGDYHMLYAGSGHVPVAALQPWPRGLLDLFALLR